MAKRRKKNAVRDPEQIVYSRSYDNLLGIVFALYCALIAVFGFLTVEMLITYQTDYPLFIRFGGFVRLMLYIGVIVVNLIGLNFFKKIMNRKREERVGDWEEVQK